MERNTNKRVCVIGAGISGLVTAKILTADGFDVVVFDQATSIGGVWTPTRTYPELRTNTTREQYAFSDVPYPKSVDDFPTAEQVRNYLEAYVDHFALRELLRLSTEVVSIAHAAAYTEGSQQSHPGFQVVVRPTGESGEPGEPETFHFDFVAVCNGVFSQPYIPHIAGRERFTGQVLHSSRLTDAALVAGKRVIVVGAGKSALDCATLAAQHAQACTLVFRTPRWMVPRYFFGIRYDWPFFTRFFEKIFHPARRGYFLGPHIAHYVDDLMRDMGLPTHRTGNPITEYFGRVLPGRYQDVGEERRQARSISHRPG